MNYYDSFGFEWSRFPTTQLDGPGRDESERTFRLKTGLTPDDVQGKTVLDVGCGMGRFLEVVSRWGALKACGIDPNRQCVHAASVNLTARANTDVVTLDLEQEGAVRALWSLEGFDLVYCLGVLHHTPDPAASFRQIAKLVKPGGMLCVWVYSKDEGYPWMKIAYFYRHLTTHLPWWLLHAICLLAVPWHYMRYVPVVGRYLWPLFPCSGHKNWQWRHLDTFDLYSPKYRFQHTELEVKCWFIEAGFTDIEVLPFPVSVRGRRPGPSEKKSRLVEAGLCRVYEREA